METNMRHRLVPHTVVMMLTALIIEASSGQTPALTPISPATVSRLEARVAELEKRLARIEARLAVTAGNGTAIAPARPAPRSGASGLPNGSVYLGKWSVSINRDNSGYLHQCPVDISRSAATFIVQVDSNDATCKELEGLYTLTPEGNLKGSPGGTFSFDSTKSQVILSGYGVGLQYLKKR
jgi:hypothetical protein